MSLKQEWIYLTLEPRDEKLIEEINEIFKELNVLRENQEFQLRIDEDNLISILLDEEEDNVVYIDNEGILISLTSIEELNHYNKLIKKICLIVIEKSSVEFETVDIDIRATMNRENEDLLKYMNDYRLFDINKDKFEIEFTGKTYFCSYNSHPLVISIMPIFNNIDSLGVKYMLREKLKDINEIDEITIKWSNNLISLEDKLYEHISGK